MRREVWPFMARACSRSAIGRGQGTRNKSRSLQEREAIIKLGVVTSVLDRFGFLMSDIAKQLSGGDVDLHICIVADGSVETPDLENVRPPSAYYID
jgi:hypothetical protein